MRIATAMSAFGLIVFSAAPSDAALAPNYQRAKELTAIIEAVASQVLSHPITKVIYQRPDQYQVIAGPCSFRASIVSQPPKGGMLGPRHFEVKLIPPHCDR